jgi:hypothetical protein
MYVIIASPFGRVWEERSEVVLVEISDTRNPQNIKIAKNTIDTFIDVFNTPLPHKKDVP